MSKEVFVISTVEARPENMPAVRAAYNRPLTDEMRAAGCLAYECYQHLDRPTVFAAIGRWTSKEAFQRHLQANQAALSDTGRLLAREPELVYLQPAS